MKTVTIQVVEGIDKGRVFRQLPVPVTIGREEGNALRLNDERVSRFHAKIQCDRDDIILTDLDSTNGTRINGNPVHIRRLFPGDRVNIGQSTLIFGSNDEIRARLESEQNRSASPSGPQSKSSPNDATQVSHSANFQDSLPGNPTIPPNLSASQAARLSELFDHLHDILSKSLMNMRPIDGTPDIRVDFADWQRLQLAQMLLARYVRGVADPETLGQ